MLFQSYVCTMGTSYKQEVNNMAFRHERKKDIEKSVQ